MSKLQLPKKLENEIGQKIIADLYAECFKKKDYSDRKFVDALGRLVKAKARYQKAIADVDAPHRELTGEILSRIDEVLATIILSDPECTEFRDAHFLEDEESIKRWISDSAYPYVRGDLPSIADNVADDTHWDRPTYLLWQARKEFLKKQLKYENPKTEIDPNLGKDETTPSKHISEIAQQLIFDVCWIWTEFDRKIGLPRKSKGVSNPTLRFVEIGVRFAADDQLPIDMRFAHYVGEFRKKYREDQDFWANESKVGKSKSKKS